MKKLLLILFIISSFNSKGTIHQIQVWNGYYQFLPPNNITVQLGDTIQWIPLDPPTMTHTITSDNIPVGAVPFDQVWQLPADTFFQYIPQVTGLYQYVCTPHIPNGMIGEFTVVNGTTSQKTYVPDDNFEAYLEANGMGDGIALNDSIFTSGIDSVDQLSLSNQNISNLIGIEDFTLLRELQCFGNNITSLDMSNNLVLEELYCDNNQIVFLNIANNTLLKSLGCRWNTLVSIDVTSNLLLEELNIPGNQLTSIDISNNVNLGELVINNNLISALDVSNNSWLATLTCDTNQLTSLDVSDLWGLDEFSCSNNSLTILDLRNGANADISYFDCSDNQSLSCIDVDNANWATTNWTVVNGSIDALQYFSTNCSGTTNIQEQTTNKELLKVTDLLGRETKSTKNKILFYIYDDGTVEKKIIIE